MTDRTNKNDVDTDDMAPETPEPGHQKIEDAQKDAAEERKEEGGYQ
jgi:hypothetical protein